MAKKDLYFVYCRYISLWYYVVSTVKPPVLVPRRCDTLYFCGLLPQTQRGGMFFTTWSAFKGGIQNPIYQMAPNKLCIIMIVRYYITMGSSSMCTKRLIQNVYLIAPVPFVITLLGNWIKTLYWVIERLTVTMVMALLLCCCQCGKTIPFSYNSVLCWTLHLCFMCVSQPIHAT